MSNIKTVLNGQHEPHLYDPQHRDICKQCDILCFRMQHVTIPLRLGPVRYIFPLLSFDEQQSILAGKLVGAALRQLVKRRLKETLQ